MQENVIISFDRTVAPVDVHGFKDVISDVLAEQGSSATVEIQTVDSIYAQEGCPVAVNWNGSYHFATPDQSHNFSESDLTVTVRGEFLNHDLLMKLLAHRNHVVNKAYRNALRGIYNLSVSIQNGEFTPEMPVAQYLRETLEAAIESFPNTN